MAETHDGAYRALFSFPRMVEDLIRIFVGGDWVDRLDFKTLEKVSERDVSPQLARREKDLLWRLRFRSDQTKPGAQDWFYVYLHIEFQARPDRFMALRTLIYKALLYQDLLRRKELTSTYELPPILTVVLYNGERSWKAPTSLKPLVETLPDAPDGFDLLNFRLIQAQHLETGQLKSSPSPVAELFQLEKVEQTAEIIPITEKLLKLLPESDRELQEAFTVFLEQVILQRLTPRGEQIPHLHNLREMPTMIAQKVERWTQQWKQEGRAEGKAEGRREGQALVFLQLLEQKFGSLSPEIRERVQRADLDRLQIWLTRILTAATLGEVFSD